MLLVVEKLQESGGCGENPRLGRVRGSPVNYVSYRMETSTGVI